MSEMNESNNPLLQLASEDLTTYPEGYNKLMNALGDSGPIVLPALFTMLVLL